MGLCGGLELRRMDNGVSGNTFPLITRKPMYSGALPVRTGGGAFKPLSVPQDRNWVGRQGGRFRSLERGDG